MKMNFTFDTRIFLLICCLLQGLTGLRLIKVSIPAYKLRGESAFLECQYELNRQKVPINTHYRYNQHGVEGNGNDVNYVDKDIASENLPIYRRVRSFSTYQHQQYQNNHQRQAIPQSHYEQYQPQRVGGNYYEQHQHQQQQQQQQQHQYPYQNQHEHHQIEQRPYETQQTAYGHSVYRGSAFSSSLAGRHGVAKGMSSGSNAGSRHRLNGAQVDNNNDDDEDSLAESLENEDHNEEDDLDGEEDDEIDGEKSEALYAIKWYKDNEEFYRYVPKAKPPKTSYRLDGVRVIEEHSDSSRVFLRGLTLNSTGLYRCEISAEAPNFSSVEGEGRMDIVFLPRDGPHIKGQQFQYQIGETLNLNCTSGRSHPASHLQWFVNDQAVLDERYLVQYNNTVHKHGLISSTLGLQLTVDGRHFHNGAMRVKCLASISPVLWKGGKESVFQRRPGIIDNREAMLLVRSSTSGLHKNYLLPSRLSLFATIVILFEMLK